MTEHKQIIFRRGNRVSLRLLTQEDVVQITEWMNDQEVTAFLSACFPLHLSQEEKWIEDVNQSTKDFVFGLQTNDNHFIGVMGLHGINFIDRFGKTGAYIGNKEYWGKGYGSEAKMILLDYAFNTLNLRKINSSVAAFNPRSHNYLKKCGYKEEGVRKKQIFHNGEYHDEILLSVFQEDWLALWRQFQEQQKV